MYGKKTAIGDEIVEAKLIKYSKKANITVDELIEKYIKRELYNDDYYKPKKLSIKELDELSKRDMERDRKNGIPPKKHDFSVFMDLFVKSEE